MSLCCVLLLTPFVIKLAISLKIVDHPNERKMHSSVIPRIGGVGIFLGFILTVILFKLISGSLRFYFPILCGATLIFLLGLLDDVFQIKARYKLIGLIAIGAFTAIGHYGLGYSVQFLSIPTGGFIYIGVFGIPLTILWILGLTNAMNLIDGLDGLAAGITAIVCITMFINSLIVREFSAAFLYIALAGACLGFLKFNFSPAKIFMGDCGSLFLGYMFAVISLIGVLKTTTAISLAIPLLALGLPVYDTITSITRRIKAGKPIFYPDRNHLHHRLIGYGFSPKRVVLIMYFETILLGIGSVIIMLTHGITSYVFLAILCSIILIIYKVTKKRYS